MPGGHWHHGELQADQMLMSRPVCGAAGYDTPVDGLFLCGAGLASRRRRVGRAGAQRRAANHGDEGLSLAKDSEKDGLAPRRRLAAQSHFRTLRLDSPFQPGSTR